MMYLAIFVSVEDICNEQYVLMARRNYFRKKIKTYQHRPGLRGMKQPAQATNFSIGRGANILFIFLQQKTNCY